MNSIFLINNLTKWRIALDKMYKIEPRISF